MNTAINYVDRTNQWKNAFSVAMIKAGAFDVYIDPVNRSVITRHVEGKRRAKKLPPGAVHVGRYRRPSSVADFVEDVKEGMKAITAANLLWAQVHCGENSRLIAKVYGEAYEASLKTGVVRPTVNP
jgi:hypothetical protein